MNMQAFYRELGANIRNARRDAGLTQDELGVLPDRVVGKATIANIEHGRQQVSAYQLQCFAEKIGVPVETLIPSRQKKKKQDDLSELSEKLRHLINNY